jgi:hypothetical protein
MIINALKLSLPIFLTKKLFKNGRKYSTKIVAKVLSLPLRRAAASA